MSGPAVGAVLVLIGPISASVPFYFGLEGWPAVPFLVLAGFSLLVGIIGGLSELSKVGLFRRLRGRRALWELLFGVALFAGPAAGFHLMASALDYPLLVVPLKILAVLFAVLAAFPLGVLIGNSLEVWAQKAEGGTEVSRGGAIRTLLSLIAGSLAVIANALAILAYFADRG